MHFIKRAGLGVFGLLTAAGSAGAQSIAAAPEWRLAATARVSIGVADGDERYMFGEVVGALRLRDGGILVADHEPPLTHFDARGTFVRRVGGRGSGPGELRYVLDAPFAYRADSIAVWDASPRRVSVFDSAGRFGRSATVTIPRVYWGPGVIPSQSCCRVRHAFSDGSFLLEFPAMIPNQPGPNRHATVTLARVSPDGSRSDTLGAFEDGTYRYDATAPNRIRELRLSLGFQYTLVGDTIIGGNGEGQWLVRIAPGAKADSLRLAGTSVRVTDGVKAAYAQAWRDYQRTHPERFEGPVESLFEGEHAQFLPAFTYLKSDPAGNIWLAQWKPPFSKTPTEYHVYTSRGRPLARIKLPALSTLAYVASDHVGLIQSDDAGVSYLRLYDIVKSPR